MLDHSQPYKISDDRFFHLREAWTQGHISAFDDDAKSDLKHLQGRYEFRMDETAHSGSSAQRDSRRFAVLRFDAEHGRISGDLFGDYRHTDWDWSFRSEAIFRNTNDPSRTTVNAIAEIFSRPGTRKPPPMKVIIAIDVNHRDGHKPFAACRIALLGENDVTLDLTMVDPAPEIKTAHLRHIKVQPKYIKGHLKPEELKMLDLVFGAGGTDLRADLQAADSGLAFDFGPNKSPLIEEPAITSDAETDEYLTFMRSQFNDDPFLFNIIFSNQTTPDGAGFFGAAKGINPKRPRYRARSTAVVYLREIMKITADTLRDETPEMSEDEIRNLTKERVRHTIIHELGHLLNLPHPWQRNNFAALGMQSDPSDKTWMAYGSLYPFGTLNGHSRILRAITEISDISEVKSAVRRKAREDSFANMRDRKHLNDPGFSQQERTWLRHAPHDWIAAGHRSFTDELRREPRLDHEYGSAFRLELFGNLDPADPKRVVHALYNSEGLPSGCQPIFGRVRLNPGAFDVAFDRLEASFQIDTLQLLIRREPANRMVGDERRPIRIVPVTGLNYDDQLVIGRKKTGLADHLLEQSALSDPTQTWIERKIPLVLPGYLSRNFGGPALFHFTVQALFRPKGHSGPVYSNKVRLDYREQTTPPLGGVAHKVRPILTNPLLPELAELANSWAKIRPQDILRRDRFGNEPTKAFQPLIKAITALAAKDYAPELEWLFNIQDRLTTQKKKPASLV